MATTPPATTSVSAGVTSVSAGVTSVSAGVTSDIGAVAQAATEALKSEEQIQGEKNTPAMVAAAIIADQVKVNGVIEQAIDTNNQTALQKLAGES